MAIKILSVDDELDMEMLIQQKFRKQIREKKYEFVFAHNGVEALEMLQQHPDILFTLSDINMPEMDGLTFLGHVNDMNNPTLKTVMVSAYGDMENIRTAMNKGAFDFVTKPINFDDLDATINKTIANIRLIENLQAEHDQLIAIQNDLSIAYDIQQAMLPKTYPPFPGHTTFDVHAFLEPAKSVGGDLFDYVMDDNNQLYFIIGDVSDKGVPASLFMAITKTLFHSHFSKKGTLNICDELSHINAALSHNNETLMFVTAFLGRLDTQTGEIEYAYAGHEPPFILRKGKGVEILPKQDSMALCFDPTFQFTTDTITLQPGDAIVMYTDGVPDALNEHNKRYGMAQVQNLLEQFDDTATPAHIHESILAELKDFAGDTPQFDDITMMTIRYLG